jgi:hypothetical protein
MFFVRFMIENKKRKEVLFIVPPSIVNNGQMINEITILQGESLVLTCLLHAVPLPTIVWIKNDQILFDSARFTEHFFVVLFLIFFSL